MRQDKAAEPRDETQDDHPKSGEAGFERWLGKQLHGLYDPVLGEAVPDDIAKLIDRFAARPDKDSGPGER